MSFYPFVGPCPKEGGDSKIYWRHSYCGGSLSINEYCDLKCNRCSKYNFILKWKFQCLSHWGDPFVPNGFQLLDTISQICRINNIPTYIRHKMINILNRF